LAWLTGGKKVAEVQRRRAGATRSISKTGIHLRLRAPRVPPKFSFEEAIGDFAGKCRGIGSLDHGQRRHESAAAAANWLHITFT
jgi:hypothetical protein